MPIRSASATWKGDLPSGRGELQAASGNVSGDYSFGSRFEEAKGTNPEELLAAAEAACFSMALANSLAKAGHKAIQVTTTAKVHLDKGDAGFSITKIVLTTEAEVPGIDDATFQTLAGETKTGCPVGKALSVPIELTATLTLPGFPARF